ncbi:hypothetical protein QFZ49_004824 [Streptomyces turgidiscabies]|uniref:Uncharacterized protein n=1 Tax=Streptomyces turgidiscabies TaxID=85558 RepID=A0ABU0RSB7_9ACTN|nr:hypothetical protein [Streptomyces turgidiscabies]
MIEDDGHLTFDLEVFRNPAPQSADQQVGHDAVELRLRTRENQAAVDQLGACPKAWQCEQVIHGVRR